jgi:protocatechuate 3,4-dioxygenase beta subunit
MKNRLSLLALIGLFALNSCAQGNSRKQEPADSKVGGECEGCEAVYESPVPFDSLKSMIWLPDWSMNNPRRIGINGIVYKADGVTPAPGVIIYIYHTDQTGIYPKQGDEKGWAKRHGYIRGWMKTNEKGEYKFFTLRPASYPEGRNPAHIHAIIKEPGKTPYWIDDYLFDDDPYLPESARKNLQNKGGNGILKFSARYTGDGPKKSERHIYLGRNITDYPKE